MPTLLFRLLFFLIIVPALISWLAPTAFPPPPNFSLPIVRVVIFIAVMAIIGGFMKLRAEAEA